MKTTTHTGPDLSTLASEAGEITGMTINELRAMVRNAARAVRGGYARAEVAYEVAAGRFEDDSRKLNAAMDLINRSLDAMGVA